LVDPDANTANRNEQLIVRFRITGAGESGASVPEVPLMPDGD